MFKPKNHRGRLRRATVSKPNRWPDPDRIGIGFGMFAGNLNDTKPFMKLYTQEAIKTHDWHCHRGKREWQSVQWQPIRLKQTSSCENSSWCLLRIQDTSKSYETTLLIRHCGKYMVCHKTYYIIKHCTNMTTHVPIVPNYNPVAQTAASPSFTPKHSSISFQPQSSSSHPHL